MKFDTDNDVVNVLILHKLLTINNLDSKLRIWESLVPKLRYIPFFTKFDAKTNKNVLTVNILITILWFWLKVKKLNKLDPTIDTGPILTKVGI